MDERLIEAVKAVHNNREGYLLFTEKSIVFADLLPRTVRVVEQLTAEEVFRTEGAVLWETPATASEEEVEERIVDTEERKLLRERFEVYRRTRDEGSLLGISMEHLLAADHDIKLLDRVIPYSSISKVRIERPQRLVIAQMVREGLVAEIYGATKTWCFDVSEDEQIFSGIRDLLRQRLPPSAQIET
jgi:hypothetical protein